MLHYFPLSLPFLLILFFPFIFMIIVPAMGVGHTPTASSRNFLQENQKETYTEIFKYA